MYNILEGYYTLTKPNYTNTSFGNHSPSAAYCQHAASLSVLVLCLC